MKIAHARRGPDSAGWQAARNTLDLAVAVAAPG